MSNVHSAYSMLNDQTPLVRLKLQLPQLEQAAACFIQSSIKL